MTHPTVRTCRFSTDRLVVGVWHATAERFGLDLADTVEEVLTPDTTTTLPGDWRGTYDRHRAARWIELRDTESPTLLVVHRETGRAIGLFMVYETPAATPDRRVDVRIGYVLASTAWGRGFGTELVAGFVRWACARPTIATISGGVEPANVASARVLTKNGFTRSGTIEGTDLYVLGVGRPASE